MPKILLIFLFLLFVLLSSAWGADVKKQLQGIKNDIKEQRHLINKTEQVEKTVSVELSQIDKNLKDKQARLSALSRDLKAAESSLEKTRHEIENIQKDIESRKQLIQNRLVAVYKAGEVGNVRFLFSSESFPQMLENLRYMKAILENDRKLVAVYNERIDKLKQLKRALESDASRKESLKVNIEVKKREIEAEKTKKVGVLVHVREDKKTYLASLRELEARSKRLQSIMERLEAASRKSYTSKGRKHIVKPVIKGSAPIIPPGAAASGFASQKGRLSLPTHGRIIDSFGRHKHPDFNSWTLSNGISISAPTGSDVHSIYEGKVMFADYFKGYGNMIIVDHGDGFFSVYAHNSRLFKKAGMSVTKNEVLASVGDIDSSKGPILYFEIRYQGRPIDPTPWVR